MIRVGSETGGGGAHSDGTARSGSTVFSLPYAERRGIDLDDKRLRFDLLTTWITVTTDRVLFHSLNQWSLRSYPKRLIVAVPRSEPTLRWFDHPGLNMTVRVVHLTFPDGRHLLATTIYQARLRRKPYSDEPDLFVQAFGDAAERVDADA